VPLQYDEYEYPTWAQLCGTIFTFIPITFVPIIGIIELLKFPGSCKNVSLNGFKLLDECNFEIGNGIHMEIKLDFFLQKLAYAITPVNEHAAIRESNYVRRFQLSHWFHAR